MFQTSVEVIGHGVVKELHRDFCHLLLDHGEFVHVKQTVLGGDAEATDLGIAMRQAVDSYSPWKLGPAQQHR